MADQIIRSKELEDITKKEMKHQKRALRGGKAEEEISKKKNQMI